MTLAQRVSATWGRAQYYRGKGQWTIETMRSWVVPGSAAGAFVKYLGVPTEWSVTIAVALPVAVETFGFFLGKFLWTHGGVEAEYALALEKDPYRIQSLERLEAIEKLLGQIERTNTLTLLALEALQLRPRG